MTFLRYSAEEPPLVEPPKSVYGRVDQIEPPDAGEDAERWINLDCIDANWFGRKAKDIARLSHRSVLEEAEWRISVVGIPLRPKDVLVKSKIAEGDWYRLDFDTGGGARPVFQSLNLFADPIERTASVSLVGPSTIGELDRLAAWDLIIEGDEHVIRELIGRPAESAAVYDVGQGNCNAMLSAGTPTLYFDFGGGVLANTRTYPESLKRFCFSSRPPVVLSHWDWDHWSSALRDEHALETTWIVPVQKGTALGNVHSIFLGKLLQKGRVLGWPGGASSIRSGQVEIVKCKGAASDRNDSGLALILSRSKDERMLFPGDAGYDKIPGGTGTFSHVVVPHHGGRTTSAKLPVPADVARGRNVYSYGAGNSHYHAFEDVRRGHRQHWKREGHTALRGAQGMGHIGLAWYGSNIAPGVYQPPCGGLCQLAIRYD